jgi:hypothetical protein
VASRDSNLRGPGLLDMLGLVLCKLRVMHRDGAPDTVVINMRVKIKFAQEVK